ILAGFDAWFGHVALAAALVALISATALVLCQAAAMAGSPAAAGDVAAVSAVLLENRFGRVWCVAARGDPRFGLSRSTPEAAVRPAALAGITRKPRLGRTRRHGEWHRPGRP